MENKFYKTENSISLNDIIEFEKSYNLKLPEEYINHILQENGGYPEKDECEDCVIASFYSIKYGRNNVAEVIHNLQTIENVLPKDLFPFAYDQGGNDFCISLAKEDYGKIYIWYHDTGGEKKFLANSFDDFMSKLVES